MKYLGTFLMLLYASFVGFAQTLIEVKSPDNRLKLNVSLSQKTFWISDDYHTSDLNCLFKL
ncbi:hypothetical protein HNP25_001999 [Arcicella rosea]|uniref:Uncharacterized protein n=1 Tax=Arcicella rosea TaxID=502909 RepID=A0A841EQQ1_9BACT|nr:hypothetical protein [Arcicella rosea]